MNACFTDTHCHFDFPPFATQTITSLEKAKQAGVRRIIIPAVAAPYFERVLELAHNYTSLYAAIGLHPLYLAMHQEEHLAQLTDLLQRKDNKLVAVGEIGLDLYRDDGQFEQQKSLLQAQLALAAHYDLPVILHSRRTHDQLVAILRRNKVPRCGVVHGFSGSFEQAQAFIRLGYYIGVGGTISYQRAQKTRAAIARLPLEHLVLETDAPDMPLAGYQGQANRPERLIEIFNILCQLRPESAHCIAIQLEKNATKLFALSTDN